jgi:hypothetical protein
MRLADTLRDRWCCTSRGLTGLANTIRRFGGPGRSQNGRLTRKRTTGGLVKDWTLEDVGGGDTVTGLAARVRAALSAEPGHHVWVVMTAYNLSEAEAARIVCTSDGVALGARRVVHVEGPLCLRCDAVWTFEVAGQACPTPPSGTFWYAPQEPGGPAERSIPG